MTDFQIALKKLQLSVAFLFYVPTFMLAGFPATEKSRMIADLDIIKNEIEINYAPSRWKMDHLGWDLEREIQLAKEKIFAADTLSSRQYQQIIRDLFNSFQDLHTGVSFYSTEYAILPFLIQGAEGRYFVVWVDHLWADSNEIPLQVGDEILAFDDQPLETLVQDIQLSAYGSINEKTYQRLSELQLTIREGNSLQNVPRGDLKITYKKNNQKQVNTFVTEWEYIPEEIDNEFSPKTILPLSQKNLVWHKPRALPLYTRLRNYSPAYRSHFLGGKKSPFPVLGTVSWKSNSKIFDAYIFSLKNKKIGYIRIPDFYADTEEAEEFRKIIAIMEGRTQALVIDVMNNPGGVAFYAYALLSILIDKPLKNLTEQITITQEDVYLAVENFEWLRSIETDSEAIDTFGQDLCGYPVNKQLIQSILAFSEFVKEQYRENKFMTDPYPLEGLDSILPHRKTRYTKPLLVLTNSMSISCGDLLPALLQDNQRAKILGCRTAGAGGYVLKRKYSNRFGVADFTLTGSLMYRFNGSPLENLGVTPDYPYEFTAKDYTTGYADFIKYVNETLVQMLNLK